MSRAFLAGFPQAAPLLAAVRAAKEAGAPALDAFTPYPVKGLAEELGCARTNIPWWMLGAGLVGAGALYGLEWFSATRAYRFDQGGRALNSWQAFLIAPVEVGVLVACLAGLAVLLFKGGLPRLNHPLFELSAFERASQDQFLIAVPAPEPGPAHAAARRRLFDGGAVWVEEVEL